MPHRPAPLRAAIHAALTAGAVARRGFKAGLKVDFKADHTPVTAADRGAEEVLRRELSRAFPDDGFVGEEFGEDRAQAEHVWVIDPIDGTKSFVRGVPFWGTLVARADAGGLELGVMYLPVLDELWTAVRGGGTFRNRRRVRVSRISRLAAAQILVAPLGGFAGSPKLARIGRIAARAMTTRGYADCWGYSFVADGRAEALVESGLNPWDVAAVKILIEEAGGRMTGWDGADSWRIRDTLASNGRLHAPLLKLLRR